MAGAHSRLPPSGAAAWSRCPGWVRALEQFPELDGNPEAAREGTAAHWVASEWLLGRGPVVGSCDPGGTVVDDEMVEGAGLYVADVLSAVPAGIPVHVEEPVTIPRVHAECWGTPDAWAWDAEHGVLYVWDFKYGHQPVDAVDNLQLIAYAAGVLDLIGVNGLQEQHVQLVLRIVQPRAFVRGGPIRVWRCLASDIRGQVNILAGAAVEALSGSPTYRAGGHCQYCAGRHACVALQTAALGAADVATRETPHQLPPAALGAELRLLHRALQLLQARCDGMEQEALRLLAGGANVPYWAAEQTVGREQWSRPVPEVLALGQLLGVDLAQPAKPITPKQARAFVDESVINAYCERQRGAMRLVPLTETHVKKVFSQ